MRTVATTGSVCVTSRTDGRLSRELQKMASTIRKKEHLVVTFSEQRSPADHVRSCDELLSECATEVVYSALLNMAGVGKRDIYNITAPFRSDGQWIIAARVESRVSELATTMFFGLGDRGTWFPIKASPLYPGLQDPCICRLGSELVFGGVRFPITLEDGSDGWRMEFYRGNSIHNLRKFFVGPDGMKDIRLCALPDSRVAVLTRPQGRVGGLGKIGFVVLDSLDDMQTDVVQRAPVFENQFRDEEWGGANEVHLLSNGLLGVLGHIACFDVHKNRHYYPMAFALDPETRFSSPIRILATRSLFPPAPHKRTDLADVLFSGGLIRNWDGTADLFAGVSDAAAGVIRIRDPFLIYEAEGGFNPVNP